MRTLRAILTTGEEIRVLLSDGRVECSTGGGATCVSDSGQFLEICKRDGQIASLRFSAVAFYEYIEEEPAE